MRTACHSFFDCSEVCNWMQCYFIYPQITQINAYFLIATDPHRLNYPYDSLMPK